MHTLNLMMFLLLYNLNKLNNSGATCHLHLWARLGAGSLWGCVDRPNYFACSRLELCTAIPHAVLEQPRSADNKQSKALLEAKAMKTDRMTMLSDTESDASKALKICSAVTESFRFIIFNVYVPSLTRLIGRLVP